MEKIEPRNLKGFRDFGPQDQLIRQQFFNTIRDSFESFGFLPMDTPVLEYKEILMGKYGDDEKLVYNFTDNGDREVAMRYDLTVPFARFVAQNEGQLTFPFKRYQIAPVWRADKPQKGRYREFYQCDIDVVGSSSPMADIEVISCLAKTFEALGLDSYLVRLNDRTIFKDFSQDAIRVIDKVEKIGVDGLVKEMKQRGVSEQEIEAAKNLVMGEAQQIPENLQQIINGLEQMGLKGEVAFDPTIARGLDYYSSTVFEFVLQDNPAFGSVCGGGRYDGLLDQFSKQSQPAVGGSIGIDRLLAALEDLGKEITVTSTKAIILNLDANLSGEYLQLAQTLRAQGVSCEVYYEAAKLDKQFKYAEQKNIEYAILIGPDEAKDDKAQLKNVTTRDQEELSQTMLIKQLIQSQ